MLLYEYPPKLNRQQRQQKALSDLTEHKKMRKALYRNLLIGCGIGVIAFFVPVAVVRILLLLIACGNIAVALLLYRYSAMSRDTECYTRIYDDYIEHKQGSLLTGKYMEVVIEYEDVEKTEQDPQGRLVFTLCKDAAIIVKGTTKRAAKELEHDQITLTFQDTRAKLFLINELHEKIKYPKKNYNVIEDEEDEDDLWDPLHKHGL
ncbi:MAG: hypothetical protein IKN17_13455 [Ruminococcus sp.]|nr:hypothetical protein [Ruminococcus sp.]